MKTLSQRLTIVIAAVFCAAASAGSAAAPGSPGFPWPGGARAAVSLAYDDALDSQLDHALPDLDRLGLRASFYLTLASDGVTRRMGDWRAAAARGHELGNHTLFHQCARSQPGHEWVSAENDLDTTSAAGLAAQVRLGNAMLQALDGRRERTLTVPCGDLLAAGEPWLPKVQGEFVAIKAGAGGVVVDMAALDLKAVGVIAPEGVSGAWLIAQAEAAAAAGTMVNFTFHGIDGEYLNVSRAAHRELLEYLAGHPGKFYVDTFLGIARTVQAVRATQAQLKGS